MPRAAHYREAPGGDGRKQGDVFWVFAQQAFGNAHEHVKATSGLQGSRAAYNCQNGQHDVDGRFAGLYMKDKAQNEQTYAADKAKAHAAKSRAEKKAPQNDAQLQGQHMFSLRFGLLRLPSANVRRGSAVQGGQLPLIHSFAQ